MPVSVSKANLSSLKRQIFTEVCKHASLPQPAACFFSLFKPFLKQGYEQVATAGLGFYFQEPFVNLLLCSALHGEQPAGCRCQAGPSAPFWYLGSWV